MQRKTIKLMHIDPDRDRRSRVAAIVDEAARMGGFSPVLGEIDTLRQGRHILSRGHVDVALVDQGSFTAAEMAATAAEAHPALPIIVLTRTEAAAVEGIASDAPAFAYLPEPGLSPRELAQTLRHAMEHVAAERERQRSAAERQSRENMWTAALDAAGQGVWLIDFRTKETFYSGIWRRIRGFAEDEDIDTGNDAWLARIHPDDRARVAAIAKRHLAGDDTAVEYEYRERRRDGQWIWIMSRGRIVERFPDGRTARIVGTDTDITEMKRQEARAAAGNAMTFRRNLEKIQKAHEAAEEARSAVAAMARYDALTGLHNWRAFREYLDRATRAARDQGKAFAIMVIDLRDFRALNDAHGHKAGDAVLCTFATRLAAAIEGGDAAMRIGPDEFAVVMETSAAGRRIPNGAAMARHLVDALREPVAVDGQSVEVGFAIGIAPLTSASGDPEAPIRAADLALRAAQQSPSHHSWQEFRASMESDMQAAIHLEKAVRAAVAEGHIRPSYQPVIDLSDGRLASFEVLARWHHPEPADVQPDDFIPVIDRLGLMAEFTYRLLETVCEEARDWPSDIRIAINITQKHLSDPLFPVKVLGILSRMDFPAERLEVEITEQAVVSDIAASHTALSALHDIGVRVSLDDFGTGYSNFDILGKLPFDKIKIDRSFILSMHENEAKALVVHSILDVSQRFALPTVAEGIETRALAEEVTRAGCRYGQGYYFGHPMPAADADRLIWKMASPAASRKIA